MADDQARELYRKGDLRGAIAAQTESVRSRPTDVDARSYLFGLLCLAGRLEQAERQLDALGAVDPQVASGVRVCRSLLLSEAQRRAVFAGEARPVLPPDAPAEVEARLAALQARLAGDADGAARRLEEAAEASSGVAGALNGSPFDAVRDGDDLLATLLEVHAGGRYVWLPLSRVRRIEALERRSILDLLWLPVRLVDSEGQDASVHLPTVYPGTPEQGDDTLCLGRATRWLEHDALGQRGVGQHVWLLYREEAETEVPLLDLQTLEIREA